MIKIALVYKKNQSDWVSCRSITSNLIESYHQAFIDSQRFQIKHFNLASGDNLFEFFSESKRLADFAPQWIAFIDHEPHPSIFLDFIEKAFQERLPRIIIHIFGDFIIRAQEWNAIEIFQKFQIQFICASPKQTALVRSLVDGDCNGVVTIPFPIRTDEYYYSKQNSLSERQHHKLSKNTQVFLYTGRLSQQKNILSLINTFVRFLTQVNSDAELWLSGPIDDLGNPYLGRIPPHGTYMSSLLNVLNVALPKSLRNHIKYFGNLSQPDLFKLYHAADFFISLSTHNDEDFGMAPAEAMACGLPLILTKWGGYSAFLNLIPEYSFGVNVQFNGLKISPDPTSALRAISEAANHEWTQDQREVISQHAQSIFSCASVSQLIRNQLESAYFVNRFNDRLDQVNQAFRLNPKAPFSNGREYSKLFRDLYEPYF